MTSVFLAVVWFASGEEVDQHTQTHTAAKRCHVNCDTNGAAFPFAKANKRERELR